MLGALYWPSWWCASRIAACWGTGESGAGAGDVVWIRHPLAWVRGDGSGWGRWLVGLQWIPAARETLTAKLVWACRGGGHNTQL
jgi:hypothetical protein